MNLKINTTNLTEQLRPKDFSELVGLDIILSQISVLQSMIFWGPPGSGKTSLAKILSQSSGIKTLYTSAVINNTQHFKDIFEQTKYEKILLVIDEIHHLNKTQQDIFLPHIESGDIILIGITTENPSFEIRPALLSRCKVLIFSPLSQDHLYQLIIRAENFFGKKLNIDEDAKKYLCELADGDSRYLLNRVEELFYLNLQNTLNTKELTQVLHFKKSLHGDKNTHYYLISALHKAIRGSDVQASLYWFSRMILSENNPLYIARRLIKIAVEDISMADPNALLQAMAALQGFQALGEPEGIYCLSQCVIYLATAPKSNAAYVAYNKASQCAKNSGNLTPPKHLINAPTKMMKEMGFAETYIYDPDVKHSFSGQEFFPNGLEGNVFYQPNEFGFEKEVKKRIAWWENLKKEITKKK